MGDVRLLESYELLEYTPEMIKESVDRNGGKIIMKGILQKADTLNQNGRIYPKAVLEREVRNYQKFIVENRALGELDHPDTCVPTGTEIFTIDGWKKIEDIADDEVVMTIDTTTNEMVYQRIERAIHQRYTGKLYRFKNARTYDMTLSPNHRVLAWDRSNQPYFITAEEMYTLWSDKSTKLTHTCLKRAGTWRGEDRDVVDVAGKTIDAQLWAAFLGIYLAEGHCSGMYVEHRQRLCSVVITQNAGETADHIRDLLKQLPWEFEERASRDARLDFVIVDEQLHSHLLQLGGSRDKYVPKYALGWSQQLLSTLLEWMLMGDGRHRYGYKKECIVPEYCTTSVRLADNVCEIMLKLGHGATIHTWEPTDTQAPDFATTGRMILAENKAPMHIVYQHSTKSISLDHRFMRASTVDYDGFIHCVVTKNQTWLMRQNGKTCWTGNSVVELKNVSHIVREAYMDGNVVRGSIEVLDKVPNGMILKGLIESGIKLGISSRGVGSTRKEGDYYVVQDDFQLICWDMVSEPSTPHAFMLPEGKTFNQALLRTVFKKSDRIDRVLNEILSGR